MRPEFDPATMVGRWLLPLFSTDWNDEARRFGKERASRRSYAGADALGPRNAGFDKIEEAIKCFVKRAPDEGDARRHPVFGARRACREALHATPDARLPPI